MGKICEVTFNIGASLGAGFKAAFSTASGTMAKLGTNIRELNAMQKMYNKGLFSGTITKKSYDEAVNKLTADLKRQKDAQNNLSKTMECQKNIASMWPGAQYAFEGAVTVGEKISSSLRGGVKAAIDFESSMADVRKVVDFDTPEQFDDMKNEITCLTQVLPMAATDIAKIVAEGGQFGIAREDLISFAENAAKMGVAFGISAEEAGQMMAQWRTAYKMSQPEVVDLADKINYLRKNTLASAPNISDVVKRIGPLGDVGGMASGEIAALGASIVGAGIESEVAATGIKNLILGLVVGEGATESQAKAFGKLGFDATDMAKRMQTDAKGAIIDVLSHIKQLDKYEQVSTLKDLFGSESLSAIAPLLSNLDNLQKNLDLVADRNQYAGSMEVEFQARCETTANALQVAKNAVMSVGIAIGNNFLPYIKSMAESFADVANKVGVWAKENPAIASSISAIGAVVGATIIGFTGLAYAALAIVSPFAELITIYKHFKIAMEAAKTAQLGFNITALANPYLLIAIAVAAACYLIYTNWDTITKFMSSTWRALCDTITNLWNGFYNFMCSAWNVFKDGFKAYIDMWLNMPNTIAYAIGFVIGYISTMPAKIGTFITAAGIWLSQLSNYCWNAGIQFLAVAEEWLSTAYDSVSSWLSQIITDAGIWLMNLPNECMMAGSNFVNAAESWASSAYDSVINWISQIPSAISDYISNAWADLKVSFTVGMNASSNGTEIASNAKGGIYGKGTFLTTFAEESGESAIPHTPNSRNIGLLARTNEIMGNPLGGGGSISATFAPNITITGNADTGTVQQIQQVLNDTLADFEHKLKALQNQKARVSFD